MKKNHNNNTENYKKKGCLIKVTDPITNYEKIKRKSNNVIHFKSAQFSNCIREQTPETNPKTKTNPLVKSLPRTKHRTENPNEKQFTSTITKKKILKIRNRRSSILPVKNLSQQITYAINTRFYRIL